MARTGKVQQRRGGLRSGARKLVAVCLSGVVLLSGGSVVATEPVEGLLRRNLDTQASGPQNGSATRENTVTCTLSGSTVSVTPATGASLALSKASLTASFECIGDSYTAVPSEKTKICYESKASNEDDSESCNFGDSNVGSAVTLQEILGAGQLIEWTETSTSDKNSILRTLKLTDSDLPRTDKTFVVGCHKKGARNATPTPPCRVPVNVSARPSSVDDKNVVICAYGKNSNDKVVEVEMSQDKNTLTIDCGKDGSMQPEDFTSRHCPPETQTLEGCTEVYTDISDKFESSWWTGKEDNNPVTLTIPQTEFPTEDKRFLLGCTPNSTTTPAPDKKTDHSPSAVKESSCLVRVTVKAASSASSASSIPQVVAATSGAALLAAIFSGSL
ncbi:SAG-related sequence SRS12B [Toxoplasma gondii VAND]|uniref:SAG-related sequence SRS12B n=2 Tax=Toxoplasma gondii TaxID=5811 RepID=A0A2T6IEK1_TOXGO|nr:SAG-related sequence SRS12B [Toxoplasma gondii VAND]PUA83772.1 SAG-related sequence SRS12B [Toxoplasma gondii TgCATBr9]